MTRVEQVQSILLVQAFEKAEPASGWFAEGRKEAATTAAAEAAGIDRGQADDEERLRRAVADRAERLVPDLDARFPSLRHLRTGVRGTSTVISLLLAGAFILGLASSLIGEGRQIHLLSVPLWGLLVWNVGLLLSLPLRSLLRQRLAGSAGRATDQVRTRGRLWTSIAVSIASKVARGSRGEQAYDAAVLRFAESWQQVGGAWVGARLLRLMHMGAGLMILGLIAGMYQRGIALEYRATWESTWLDASSVQSLMSLLLRPASLLSGIEIPDVAPLQAPGSGLAAPWIHLFALTALLFVVIPRGLLWGYESLRMARLGRGIEPDWNDPYYRKIFAVHRGRQAAVAVIPFSFGPPSSLLARIKDSLFGALGAAAEVRVTDPVPYEGEAADSWQDWMDRSAIVLLFSAAQSPETEVHGAFVRDWTARCGAARILVLLDSSGYAERVDAPRRIEERIEAWRRALQSTAAPLTVVPVEGDDAPWLRELAPRLDRAVAAAASSEAQR